MKIIFFWIRIRLILNNDDNDDDFFKGLLNILEVNEKLLNLFYRKKLDENVLI